MKLLVWALLILALLWLLRGKKSADHAAARSSAHASAKTAGEAMVQCAHCGVYVPASESVVAVSGTPYCSEEHRLRHAS